MRVKVPLFIALAWASSCDAASAPAEPFTFDGHRIVLNPPSGYCNLDPKLPPEAALIEEQKRIQSAYTYVVTSFSECGDLSKFRGGTLTRMSNVGGFGIILNNGAIAAARGVSRDDFLNGLANAPKIDAQAVMNDVNSKVKNLGSNAAVNLQSFGMLQRDGAAVYQGGVAVVRTGAVAGPPRISVVALTLINSLPISMTIARDADANFGLTNLLAMQRKNAAALVQDNAAIEATATQGDSFIDRINWTSAGLAGLIAGGLWGLGSLGLLLIKRLLKRRAA